jgi:putative transposase
MFMYISETKREKKFSVLRMYSALKVCEMGYYKRGHTWSKPKAVQFFLVKIHEILDGHLDNRNYGIERVMIASEQCGEKASRSMVIRAMQEGNLLMRAEEALRGLRRRIKRLRDSEILSDRTFRQENREAALLSTIKYAYRYGYYSAYIRLAAWRHSWYRFYYINAYNRYFC